jgi:Virus neck protein
MAISQYFNNYGSLNEQRVIEDIITESIKIMGFECYYLPNDNDQARDLLFGEDPVKKFQSAFQLEMYLSNATEYGGEKEFFSKFGLEIKNNVQVIVSKRAFSQRVPQNTFTRPREGDLIYIPFLNGTGELFEIKFTNQTKDFFMLGRKVPYFYELEMEKFKYSQEIISTGVTEIDSVVTDSAYTLHLNTGAGTGTYAINEIVYQSSDSTYANANTVAVVQSWIPSSNTLSVTNIAGEFIDNQLIIGQSSNARYTLTTFDPLNNPANKENYDNEYIANSASSIIDFSETNPFGNI